MAFVRILYRLPLIGTSTALTFVCWLGSRPLGLLSRSAARRSHAAIVSIWARSVTRILGVRVRFEGPKPEPPFFLVSNHLSYLDIPVMLTGLDANFLAKSEVARWPLIGFLARATGTLFIDRTMRADLKRVIPEVRSALDGGRGVIVFPEGTSTQGAEVLPFRTSLFEVPAKAGIEVRTAAVHYTTPEHATPAHLSVCWWGDMDFLPHFMDLMKLPSVEARVRFAAEALRSEDRRELADSSLERVRELFDPVADAPAEAAPCRD